MTAELDDSTFTSHAAVAALVEACTRLGLSPDAQLLRFGENAIFRLSSAPIVVRIARSADRLPVVEKELCVARWLHQCNVRAVQPVEDLPQALLVDGLPVSFWHAVPSGDPRPGPGDLAQLLRAFHAAGEAPCDLPALDPFWKIPDRIAAASPMITKADRAFLTKRYEQLSADFAATEFMLPVGPLHGDAHTGNLLGAAGSAVLADFEMAANGPREWDLVPLAVACSRFRLPREAFASFTGAYGVDVTAWSGYGVLRDIRELGMTTWLMQNVDESPAVAAEVRLRIDSLRAGDTQREWHVF